MDDMGERDDAIGWRSYVPGLALVLSVVGALLAAGSLIQKVSYLEAEAAEQARDIAGMEVKQNAMMATLERIDERTKRIATGDL